MSSTNQTEPTGPVVRDQAGGVTRIETSCRCGWPILLIGDRQGYRVTRRSRFLGLVLALRRCPNRNCRQPFPELVDADRISDLFDR